MSAVHLRDKYNRDVLRNVTFRGLADMWGRAISNRLALPGLRGLWNMQAG